MGAFFFKSVEDEGQRQGSRFLFRRPVSQALSALKKEGPTHASPPAQDEIRQDALVRLPSFRESHWKVRVLQRWVGRVEVVLDDRLIAVLSDTTNQSNPSEEVELDINEVSPSDLKLLAPGATFYWSIGYRDSPGGQRERVSTLRLARQPRPGKADVNRIFAQAESLAAFLETD